MRRSIRGRGQANLGNLGGYLNGHASKNLKQYMSVPLNDDYDYDYDDDDDDA